MNTKTVGDISEAHVLAALLRAGKHVLQPFGDNRRYDLAIDEGDGRMGRVQCKTGRLRKGAIRFPACSTACGAGLHPGARRAYHGEIDYFGVYCPETGETYLIPLEADGPAREGTLRVDPPKNNQKTKVRWAKDYVLH